MSSPVDSNRLIVLLLQAKYHYDVMERGRGLIYHEGIGSVRNKICMKTCVLSCSKFT